MNSQINITLNRDQVAAINAGEVVLDIRPRQQYRTGGGKVAWSAYHIECRRKVAGLDCVICCQSCKHCERKKGQPFYRCLAGTFAGLRRIDIHRGHTCTKASK